MSRIRLFLVSCLIAAPAFAAPDVGVSLPNKLAPIGEAMHGAVVLTNGGTSTASNISVNYQPPVETTLVNVIAPSGTTCHGTLGSNAMVNCTVSSLAAGTQMTIDVLTQVPSNLSSGTQLQLFAQAVTPSDFNSANDNATSTMTAVVRPRLRMTSSLPSTYVPGTSLTYSLTVTNDGPGTANNFTIADALNRYDLLTVSVKTRGSGSLNCQGSTTISCSGNNLASGASAIVDVTVTPSPKLGGQTNGSLTETASVTQTDFGLVAATFSGTTTVNDVADLGITGTAQSANAVGDDLAYTVTITNAGPSSTRRAMVSWNTPTGTTFLSVSPATGCATPLAGAAGIVTCNVAALDPGATATYVFHAEVPASGSVTNSATVTLSTDPNAANNTTSTTTNVTVTPLADLSLVVSGDAYAIAGRPFNVNLVVQNAGPSTAKAVTVTLTGFTNASGTNCTGDSTLVCSIGDVLSGGLAGLNVSATTTSALPNVTVAATVATQTTDPNSSNNGGSITLPLYPASADLSLEVAGLASVTVSPRANMTFSASIVNHGPAPADGTLHVMLPDGASLVSGGDCPNSLCGFTAVMPGLAASFGIPIKAPAAIGTYAAHFRVDGVLSDPNPSDNDVFVPFTVSDGSGAKADLAVTMTAPVSIAPNGVGIWSATIANHGTSDALLPKLTLSLPADAVVAAVPSGCATGSPIVCSIATLASGASQTFAVPVRVGSTTIAAEAVATSATTDANVSDNITSTTTSVATSPLGIAMQPSQAVASTKPVSFTITLTNRGTTALTNVALHAFVTMAISLTSTKANCSSAVDCSLASLAANDTFVINGVATGAGTAAFVTTADGVPSNGALLRVSASDQHHRAARH